VSRRKTKRKHSMVEIIGLAAIGIFVVGIIWLAFFTQPTTPSQTTTNTIATDFTLTDVDGNTFRLSDQQGKVVVLEFMRTTCSACVAESARLKDLRSQFGNDVVMVMISVDPAGDTDNVLRDYRNQDMNGWIAMGDRAEVTQGYAIQATPTIFIIDKNGYIRYQHVGLTETSVLFGEVQSLTK
jgi:cytochrome c biogenesis protein CcmG/thiol:disulfide interchange protein DsbE